MPEGVMRIRNLKTGKTYTATPGYTGPVPEGFELVVGPLTPERPAAPGSREGVRVPGRTLFADFLREPPQGTAGGGSGTADPGRWVRGLADVVLPNDLPDLIIRAVTGGIPGGRIAGPLMRSGAAGLVRGAESLLRGQSAGQALGAGASGAGSQMLGEGIVAPLGFGMMQRAGRGPLAYRAAEKQRFETEKAQHPGKVFEQKQAVERRADMLRQKQSESSEQAMAGLAAAFDARVPSWQGIPRTTEGVVDRVFGSGQEKLSAMFDAAMKGALAEARGMEAPIPMHVADTLGVPYTRTIEMKRGDLAARDATVIVDAANLIKKMTGQSKNHREEYRIAADTLVDLGVGNEAARAEYTAGQAFIRFIDTTGALKKTGEFDPVKAAQGLRDVETVDLLRRRGQGHALEGPFSEAVRSSTLPPSRPIPDVPPPRPPDLSLPQGMTTRQIPSIHPWQGAMMAGIPAMMYGHSPYHWGPAAGLGAILGPLLGRKEFVTRAPLGPGWEQFLRSAPSAIGPAVTNVPQGP